jgi:hypothetical protein
MGENSPNLVTLSKTPKKSNLSASTYVPKQQVNSKTANPCYILSL